MGLGGLFGLFRETPVRVGSGRRPDRRPRAGRRRAAARRESPRWIRCASSGTRRPACPPRYVVYVGPTETFSPRATTEPWDLTSNVAGSAGQSAGSFRATEQAMRDAGIGVGRRGRSSSGSRRAG